MAELPDFQLLPQDDSLAIGADDELDAAEASALAPPVPEEVAEERPDPPGRSWAFDFMAGRTVRRGLRPVETHGLDSLKQRCLMAVYSARFAHDVFTDEFGMERPNDLIGEVVEEEDLADWEARLADALLAVDGVAAVHDFDTESNRDMAAVLSSFRVTSDNGATIPFDNLLVDF